MWCSEGEKLSAEDLPGHFPLVFSNKKLSSYLLQMCNEMIWLVIKNYYIQKLLKDIYMCAYSLRYQTPPLL